MSGVPSLSSGGQKPDNKVLAGQQALRSEIPLDSPIFSWPQALLGSVAGWLHSLPLPSAVSLCLTLVISDIGLVLPNLGSS